MSANVLNELTNYLTTVVLKGEAFDLDSTTPLLDVGILTSLEVMTLLRFIEDRFSVLVTPNKIVAESFSNLATITNLVMELINEQEESGTK